MPKGDKSRYSAKQQREAKHIEDSYETKGVNKKRSEEIAWRTLNKQSGGLSKS